MSHFENSTVTKTASNTSNKVAELEFEQAYLTMLYQRLDEIRDATANRLAAVRRNETVDNLQARSERESFAELYQDRGAELNAAERNLCFGRLDFDDDDAMYIGRIGLRNSERDQLLVDWRAPASQAFYRATPRERYGVTRRRHLHTVGRRVVDLDDDVLDLDAVDQSQLTGEAALLASLRRGRTGRMSDIVATIQGDQDRIVRDQLKGILVVEGGPGTGKTVVALHRAAYLLYTYREQLAKRGILVVGPNTTFMRYIDQVLPSLGENDVVLATVGSLFPGVEARAQDDPAAARVKGDTKMAGVLADALGKLQQVPARTLEIKIDGTVYRLTPRGVGEARAKARRRRDPFTRAPERHNVARSTFVGALLDQLTRQGIRQLGGSRVLQSDDIEDLKAELASEPAIRKAIDVLWPELTPQQFLALVYRQPELLDLPDDERAALRRADPAAWTVDDVPLLDEAAELLGELAATRIDQSRAAARQRAEQAEQLEYASDIVDKLRADDAIEVPFLEVETFKSWVAGRFTAGGPSGSLAERAPRDREWTYAHVVVDEAQELSAMAWRMLIRRCPTRSMTVVGDLAQTGSAGGTDSWAQVLDPLAPGRWRTARLTVNYRTPKPAAELASRLLPASVIPPIAVRDSDDWPWWAPEADLAELVRRESAAVGTGRVAVIAPPDRTSELAGVLGIQPGPDLDAPVAVLTPDQTKGLEFDSVLVVDAAEIVTASPRGRADLYVSLTRTTRRLGLVGSVPDELGQISSSARLSSR